MSKDGSSSDTPPEDLPKVDGGPAPGARTNAASIGVEDASIGSVRATTLDERATSRRLDERLAMRTEAGIISGDAIRVDTIRPASITAPVEPDVAERVFALHEARKVLEASTGTGVFSAPSKTPPPVGDLIRVARYIVTGTDPKEKN